MAIVKFDDVVVRANTKEDRFNTERLYYVGGEHIESNEVTIQNRGLIEGSTIGPMFYFGFKAGQVLFVTRNPHLRKAGWVGFDGICSEKTFVLETKDENVLCQRFLPFILQSDHFWDYCEANKSGSVNFFVNWSTLAKYEFELPDIETQRKLAEVLWAMERTKQAYKRLISATDELVKSQFMEQVSNIPETQYRCLDEVCSLITDGTHNPPKFVNSGIPFLLVSNVTGNVITYDTDKHITEETYAELTKRTPIEIGDVLLSTVGSYGHPAIVEQNRRFCFQRHIAQLKPKHELLNSKYLHSALLAPVAQEQIERLVLGVAQKTLNLSAIKSIRIPVPPIDEQIKLVTFIKQTDKSKYNGYRTIIGLIDLISFISNERSISQ